MPAFKWKPRDLVPIALLIAAAVWPLANVAGQTPVAAGQPVAQPAVKLPAPPQPAPALAAATRGLVNPMQTLTRKAPRVAMLVTGVAKQPADSVKTQLIIKAADAQNAELAASVEHAASAVVRGTMIPRSTKAAVVLDLAPSSDRTWSGSLVVLDPLAAGARAVGKRIDGVYLGTPPLALEDGRLIVQRGSAGPAPTDEDIENFRMREDQLSIDAILPNGTLHSLRQYKGQIAYVAGAAADRIIVYRVAANQAALITFDPDGDPALDRIVPVPAFASDFTPNPAAKIVLFTNRTADGKQWSINQVDRSGAVTTLSLSPVPQIPSVWINGVSLAAKSAGALEIVGPAPRDATLQFAPLKQALSARTIKSVSSDQKWAIGIRSDSGTAAEPVVIYTQPSPGAAEAPIAVTTPQDTRLEMLEVLP